jgi:hypothetical protein
MPLDKRLVILKILDDQNTLSTRADTKAIALLTSLGFFTAFFINWIKGIEPTPFTATILATYLISALFSLFNIIMAINPRIRISPAGKKKQDSCDPSGVAFFAEISRFSSIPEYQKCLAGLFKDEETVIDVYSKQIFEVSRITAAKYKYTQRAVYMVMTTLSLEFVMIIYLFTTGT